MKYLEAAQKRLDKQIKNALDYEQFKNSNTESVLKFIIENEDSIRYCSTYYRAKHKQQAILNFLSDYFDSFDEKVIVKALTNMKIPSRTRCNVITLFFTLITYYIPFVTFLVYNVNEYTAILVLYLFYITTFAFAMFEFYYWILFESRKFYFKNSDKYSTISNEGF